MVKRMRISLGLMLISIILLVAFQSWWLRKSFKEEAENLQIKTNFLFREAVLRLQVSKMKLDSIHVRSRSQKDAVEMVNAMKERMRDSFATDGEQTTMILKVDRTRYPVMRRDSLRAMDFGPAGPEPERVFYDVLYNSDSPNDTLSIKEINDAFALALQREKMNLAFEIIKSKGEPSGKRGVFQFENRRTITVGLSHPATFSFQLLNTTPYLLRQISPQMLISFFLLAVTTISFISLYRNLMAQKKLAGIKNEFISNITHELKTPIATVSVAVEALKNFNALDDPDRTKEYLDISQNELQRLSLLVDKVLKLSMFENKEIELKHETVDLRQIVDEVTASIRLQLEKFKAQVVVEEDGNSTIQGDRLHLLSVVFNLLDNALKYSKGVPSIQIILKEEEEFVILTIVDNGIGIAPEYKDKIFEKFFRVPAGDTHNAKGYGLGLSYVAHVVRRHKGEIEVDSQLGIGSRFTIKLPNKA